MTFAAVFALLLVFSVRDTHRFTGITSGAPFDGGFGNGLSVWRATTGAQLQRSRLEARFGRASARVSASTGPYGLFWENAAQRPAEGERYELVAWLKGSGEDVSSINNAFVLAQHYSLATPFYFATQAVWEFPAASHVGLTYENVFGIDARTLYADFFRANALSPRVTTLGLPGEAAADFGWSAPFAILGLGVAIGAVHRAAEWSGFYRALYAVLMVGLLDFVRTDYFVATRVVPAYLLFAAMFVLVARKCE